MAEEEILVRAEIIEPFYETMMRLYDAKDLSEREIYKEERKKRNYIYI